jgi:SAM-dependent MidA family methyltransferase
MSGELSGLLASRIAEQGPITVAAFVEMCLAHPRFGYYATRDPFGVAGDFITAPEISQMFGELIGLWAAVAWQAMGAPRPVVLAELGPGRGTLMADLLRAAAMVPDFLGAVTLCLVETSPLLRQKQKAALNGRPALWLDDVRDLPDGPLILIANEFFDALPISQFVRRADGWHERAVDWIDGRFAFVDGPLVTLAAPPSDIGDVFEVNLPGRAIAAWIGARLADQGGVALVIDYGHDHSAVGDTFQAVSRHQAVSPLAAPGEADLTAHVDFAALAAAAQPAQASPIVDQGRFLASLGIEARADRLAAAHPQTAEAIRADCRRLIESSGMGTLFKAMTISAPGMPPMPGFEL